MMKKFFSIMAVAILFYNAQVFAGPPELIPINPCWMPYSGNDSPSKECEKQLTDQCSQRGGRWGGVIQGRGRSPGCHEKMPDSGKACKRPNECKGGCVSNNRPPPEYVCAEFEGYKGCGILMDTAQGIKEICVE